MSPEVEDVGGGEDDRRAAARLDADERLHLDAVYTLARAAERHDEDTGHHVLRIRRIVEFIAKEMGLPEAEAIGYDAMLHDVGKLAVPIEILRKPADLTDAETATMRRHTLLGQDILSGPASMERASRIARSHHERWDGNGYPDGIAGEAIPIEARITSCADVLDALVARRVYKEAWPYEEALAEIVRLAGTRLDPDVVQAIVACDRRGELRPIFDAGS